MAKNIAAQRQQEMLEALRKVCHQEIDQSFKAFDNISVLKDFEDPGYLNAMISSCLPILLDGLTGRVQRVFNEIIENNPTFLEDSP